MGEKLAFMGAPVLIAEPDANVPQSTVLFVSPRKYTEVVAIRKSSRGVTGSVERHYESESEWAKRCAVISSLGVM